MPPLSLFQKAALITGAGSGINYCLAKLLLSKGCNVLIADIALRPEAHTLLDQYKSEAPRAIFHKTDVTIWSDLEAAMQAGITAFGALDIVVPGAGVFEPAWSTFWNPPSSPSSKDTRTSNSYAQLSINLTHPIRLTQLAIAHFLSRSPSADPQSTPSDPPSYVPGTILHISSIAAQATAIEVSIYAAAKAGLSHFVRSLALLEPTRSIRVAAVAPGLVKTPLFTDNPDKLSMVDEEKDIWATPEEVAEAMVDLIGMEGDEVGGKVMEVGAGNRRWVEGVGDPGPGGGKVRKWALAGAGEEGRAGTEGLTATRRAAMREEVFRKAVRGWGQEAQEGMGE